MNRIKIRSVLTPRSFLPRSKELTDEQIMEKFENIDYKTLEELNDDFNERLIILLTHSGLMEPDTINRECLSNIRYLLGLIYTPPQEFTPEERSELLEHVKILEDEITQELESSMLKGGGFREIFVKLLIYLTLITYLGATVNNHFIRSNINELSALKSNNQCGKEMAFYSNILGMFFHRTMGKVFDLSILHEYIPGMEKSVWDLALMAAKLSPQYIAQYLGAQRTCFSRVKSINDYFESANMIWNIYASISMCIYATFIEKKTKRSTTMTYWVYAWRGLFGVGNPILGPPRLLIEGASNFIEYCSKKPAQPTQAQSALEPEVPLTFAQAQSAFAQREVGKLGGKFTKRKNKIRKTKKY
jgi:hypothetical protein